MVRGGAPLPRRLRRHVHGRPGCRQGSAPGRAALLDLSRGKEYERRTGSVGSRSHRAHGTGKGRSDRKDRRRRRHREGTLPPATRWLEWMPPGISEGQGRNGQRLGRQQRAAAGGFLRRPMRTALFIGVLIVTTAHPSAAQNWSEYVSTQDGFKINFPGQPKITETAWKTQMDYTLPGRVYSAERGRERYSMTVVDYSGLEQQGIARGKTCPPGNEQCRENTAAVIGPGYW